MTSACCSRSGLGRIAFEWNRVQEAQSLLEQGYLDSRRMGIAEQITCDLLQAEIQMDLGYLDQARSLLQDHIDGMSRRQPFFALDRLLKADWIRLNLLCGNRDHYAELLASLDIDVFSNPMEEMEALILARCFCDLHEYESSLEICQKLLPGLEKGGRLGSMIRALTLQSVSEWGLGRADSAIFSLTKALNLSAREDYIRTYLNFGTPMLEMLKRIEKSTRSEWQILDRSYLSRLIGIFEHQEPSVLIPQGAKVTPGTPDSAIQFTDQEKKVLRYLIAGQNNREIGNELCVSINTVKTHVGNIYEKLGVHNRFQANIRLQELKIKL